MADSVPEYGTYLLTPADIQALVVLLRERGLRVIGPRVRDGAVVLEEISATDQLPAGWRDEQAPGRYRLARRDVGALFGPTVGPHSLKRYLLQPRRKLWAANREDGDLTITPARDAAERYAFLGVRPCDLAALARLDRVLLEGPYVDAPYRERRSAAVVVAVNCTRFAETCFCTTMDTGPRATAGFDLALTELIRGKDHGFVADVGSETGAELVGSLRAEPAVAAVQEAAAQSVAAAAERMERRFEPAELRDLLLRNVENLHWEEVGARCQGCGNCTAVCPTCFCHTTEDTTDIGGTRAERWRRQASCFSVAFSYIHGGAIRPSSYARYRHWMVHKLATWWEQFGSPGCIGCGRCIAWCPVGIDITAEAATLRDRDLEPESIE